MNRSDWITDGTKHIRKSAIQAFEPFSTDYETMNATGIYLNGSLVMFNELTSKVEEMLFSDSCTCAEHGARHCQEHQEGGVG